jgi:hypothetical protein
MTTTTRPKLDTRQLLTLAVGGCVLGVAFLADWSPGLDRLQIFLFLLGTVLLLTGWFGHERFGRFMGNLVARVVLTLFYFTVFPFFGLPVTLSKDFLQLKPGPSNNLWRSRTTGDQKLKDLLRQS